jgi:hypothetical protein
MLSSVSIPEAKIKPPPVQAVANATLQSNSSAAAVATTTTTTTTIANKKKLDEDQYWEKLQRKEKKRLEIIGWVEQPFWQTLCHWNGTVLKCLASDSLLWMTMIIYIAVRIMASLDTLPEYLADVSKGNVAVIGSFM